MIGDVEKKKLNKKGFTLVELLAVIVVIALVLALSTYGIINAYKKSKENAYVLNEKSILEAARIYSGEPDTIWNTDFDDKDYFCTSILQLKNKGLLKNDIKTDKIEATAYILVEKTKDTGVIDSSRILTGKNEDETTLIDNVCSFKRYIINYYEKQGKTTKPKYTDIFEKFNSGNNLYTIKYTLANKSNEKFLGWREDGDLDGSLYKEGNSFEINKNTDLYGEWQPINYVTIKFYTDGGEVTGNGWSIQSGKNLRPINYNNSPYTIKKEYNSNDINLALNDFNITRSGYEIDSNSYWKCASGCKVSGNVYNITSNYNTNAFCDASNGSCEVSLKINWLKNSVTPRPVITTSDDVPTGEQHPTDDYTLEIISEDDDEIYYYDEEGVKDCQSYSSSVYSSKYTTPINAPDQITTFCAVAIKDGTPSEPESYVAIPSVKIITLLVDRNTGNIASNNYYTTNSSNANSLAWFNKNTINPAIVYIITDDAVGNISSKIYWNVEGNTSYNESNLTQGTLGGRAYNSEYYNQYKNSYLSKVFTSYPVSDNKYIFLKTIGSDGARYLKFEYKNRTNDIYFKYDNTPPVISGWLKNVSTKYYTLDYSKVGSLEWLEGKPVVKWSVKDNVSVENNPILLRNYSMNAYYNKPSTPIETGDYGTGSGTTNQKTFERTINEGGYRKIGIRAYDSAGNYSTKYIYFRFYTNECKTTFNLSISDSHSNSSKKYERTCYTFDDSTSCWITAPEIPSGYSSYNWNGWTKKSGTGYKTIKPNQEGKACDATYSGALTDTTPTQQETCSESDTFRWCHSGNSDACSSGQAVYTHQNSDCSTYSYCKADSRCTGSGGGGFSGGGGSGGGGGGAGPCPGGVSRCDMYY